MKSTLGDLQTLIKGYLENAAGLGRDALLPNSHGDIWVDKASAALAQTIRTAIDPPGVSTEPRTES
jgi:hypothetical protein